jgi:hypothetical protein
VLVIYKHNFDVKIKKNGQRNHKTTVDDVISTGKDNKPVSGRVFCKKVGSRLNNQSNPLIGAKAGMG